jgi:hypothetical protein
LHVDVVEGAGDKLAHRVLAVVAAPAQHLGHGGHPLLAGHRVEVGGQAQLIDLRQLRRLGVGRREVRRRGVHA